MQLYKESILFFSFFSTVAVAMDSQESVPLFDCSKCTTTQASLDYACNLYKQSGNKIFSAKERHLLMAEAYQAVEYKGADKTNRISGKSCGSSSLPVSQPTIDQTGAFIAIPTKTAVIVWEAQSGRTNQYPSTVRFIKFMGQKLMMAGKQDGKDNPSCYMNFIA